VSSSFNAAIANYVSSNLAQFKTDSDANWQARIDTMPSGTKNLLPPQAFTFASNWTPAQINNQYISIIVRLDYFNGGANGTQLLQTFNYDVATGKIMTLADLFPNVPTYLQQISQLAIQELTSSMSDASNGNAPADMIKEGAAPTADNYANFTFTDYIVTVYFPKYQVAPGSFGEQQIGITRSTID
jgi:D-alanyl-lipoteichoic acid acyltransferase DltB (MBOAT superfamily)